MTLTTYYTTKRINSMIQPDNDSATGQITVLTDFFLKDETDLNNPVFVIAASNMPETNYCILTGTGYTAERPQKIYYFVNKIVQVRKTVWEFHCTVDVLATWKSEILPQSAFVVRSTSRYNPYITDSMLPTKNEVIVRRAFSFIDANFVANANSSDATIIVALASDGDAYIGSTGSATMASGVHLYAFSIANATELFNNLCSKSWAITIAESFGGNIANAILGAWWLPIKYSEVNGELKNTVSLVTRQISTSCKAITTAYKYSPNNNSNVQLNHFGDYRDIDPMRNYYAKLPWLGEVELNNNYINMINRQSGNGNVTVKIDRYLDYLGGTMKYLIYMNNYLIGNYDATCRVDLPVSAMSQSLAGKIIGSVAEYAGIGKLETGNSIAQERANLDLRGITLFGNSSIGNKGKFAQDIDWSGIGKGVTIVGGISGSTLGGTDAECAIYEVVQDTSVDPSTIASLLGRPYHGVAQLSSLSGYVKTENFYCTGRMSSEEKTQIEMLFNTSGVYLT